MSNTSRVPNQLFFSPIYKRSLTFEKFPLLNYRFVSHINDSLVVMLTPALGARGIQPGIAVFGHINFINRI